MNQKIQFNPKPCPAHGQGVHSWVYYAACRAVDAGMSDAEAVPAISRLMTREPSPSTEVEDALASARGERNELVIRWPDADAKEIEAIARDDSDRLEIWRAGHAQLQADHRGPDETIDALFPGNPWLCVAKSNEEFWARRRESLRGYLSKYALIVPSPMIAQRGLVKSGLRQSQHALSNVGPRRFLIVECDSGDLHRQAAVLWRLAKICPLAAVVFSAGKSLHGWFFCLGQPESVLFNFMLYAVRLGADPKMWSSSQFCRMPNGQRSDGKVTDALQLCGWDEIPLGRQALLYFNREAV